MMKDPFFRNKQILVIDADTKTANDRTWCFWETDTGFFEDIVHHRWSQLDFFSDTFSATLSIAPYQYKMIRGIDLYAAVQEERALHPFIHWSREKVISLTTENDQAVVRTETATYTADYVFNSILFRDARQPFSDKGYHLLQHFTGWMIETPEAVFDPAKARFMDFRLDQAEGTTFMYVLPVSAHAALVEYTLFTQKILAPEQYMQALHRYITENLGIKNYHITHEEFGVIPMTNHVFPMQQGRIIYTGIAGGQAKGSSGYTFRFIQKRADQLINALKRGEAVQLQRSFSDKKFHLYDSVLLQVLQKRKLNGDAVFTAIFQKNPVQRVLRFLDNESTITEDLQIMRSVPMPVFLPAALRELFS